jgi:hypothetical protein
MLFSVSSIAQDLPRIAVYVTGNVGDDVKNALGTRMLASLVNSGRYKGIERSNSFLAEIDKEQEKQRSGAIDDNQISALGKQFGVKYVCISDITPVLGAFQISARIVDVETAGVAFIGESYSALRNVIDLVSVCDQVVKNMFGGQTAIVSKPRPKPEPKPEPEPAPEPEPVPEPAAPEPPPAAVIQEEPEPEPAYAPEHKPYETPDSPKQKPKKRAGWGVGFLFSNDFGGGLKWDNGEQIVMPYNGGGAYFYLDFIYTEIFADLLVGAGKWRSADTKYSDNLTDISRYYANFGAFAKYPFGSEKATFFPLLGIEYQLSLGKAFYDFKAYGDGHYRLSPPTSGKSALSALWFKLGVGIDRTIPNGCFRTELLYGFRTANAYEKENAEEYGAKPIPGHGLTLKTGVGLNF